MTTYLFLCDGEVGSVHLRSNFFCKAALLEPKTSLDTEAGVLSYEGFVPTLIVNANRSPNLFFFIDESKNSLVFTVLKSCQLCLIVVNIFLISVNISSILYTLLFFFI